MKLFVDLIDCSELLRQSLHLCWEVFDCFQRFQFFVLILIDTMIAFNVSPQVIILRLQGAKLCSQFIYFIVAHSAGICAQFLFFENLRLATRLLQKRHLCC